MKCIEVPKTSSIISIRLRRWRPWNPSLVWVFWRCLSGEVSAWSISPTKQVVSVVHIDILQFGAYTKHVWLTWKKIASSGNNFRWKAYTIMEILELFAITIPSTQTHHCVFQTPKKRVSWVSHNAVSKLLKGETPWIPLGIPLVESMIGCSAATVWCFISCEGCVANTHEIRLESDGYLDIYGEFYLHFRYIFRLVNACDFPQIRTDLVWKFQFATAEVRFQGPLQGPVDVEIRKDNSPNYLLGMIFFFTSPTPRHDTSLKKKGCLQNFRYKNSSHISFFRIWPWVNLHVQKSFSRKPWPSWISSVGKVSLGKYAGRLVNRMERDGIRRGVVMKCGTQGMERHYFQHVFLSNKIPWKFLGQGMASSWS